MIVVACNTFNLLVNNLTTCSNFVVGARWNKPQECIINYARLFEILHELHVARGTGTRPSRVSAPALDSDLALASLERADGVAIFFLLFRTDIEFILRDEAIDLFLRLAANFVYKIWKTHEIVFGTIQLNEFISKMDTREREQKRRFVWVINY